MTEIKHYGVLGMKWGRRKDKGNSAVSSKPKAEMSEDAKSAKAAGEKAKSSGVSSLSNKELQSLNERLNLEANYSRLTTSGTKEKTAADRGEQIYKGMKKAVDIGNDIYRTYNSPVVKMLRDEIKKAR